MPPGPGEKVTKIDKEYLQYFQKVIDEVNKELRTKIKVVGTSSDPGSSGVVPVVDGNLKLPAGSDRFAAANYLNTKLKAVGVSVAKQNDWLEQLLRTISTEVNRTIEEFDKNEDFTKQTAEKFKTQFSGTVSAFGGQGGAGGTPPPTVTIGNGDGSNTDTDPGDDKPADKDPKPDKGDDKPADK